MKYMTDRTKVYSKKWGNWIREEDPHGFKESGGEQDQKHEHKSIVITGERWRLYLQLLGLQVVQYIANHAD